MNKKTTPKYKPQVHKIEIPLYKDHFYLVLADSAQEGFKYLTSLEDHRYLTKVLRSNPEDDNFLAFCIESKQLYMFIPLNDEWCNTNCSGFLGTIAHECVHIMQYIDRGRNVYSNSKGAEEPGAYLYSYIFEETLNKILDMKPLKWQHNTKAKKSSRKDAKKLLKKKKK